MIRIAEIIARKEKARALVTGESLGQVASQTLENIAVIETVSSMPILRPLIGLDKQEIMDLAKEYGTYDISILPYEDCCGFFVPKHPETKANLAIIQNVEKRIEMDFNKLDIELTY